jgi:hypothetical protein
MSDGTLDRLLYQFLRKGDISFAKFKDDAALSFGDAKDVGISWNGTNLAILPLVDDTGAINVGNGTKDMDVKVFLGTAAKYALFDVGNSCVTLAGVDLKFSTGGGSISSGASSLTICGGDTARDDLLLYGSSVVTSRGTVSVGDFASSYTTPGQAGLGIPLGNATNPDIRAFIVASTDGTIQPTKRIESSCHSFVQSMAWATTTLSVTALEGVFYGGFDLVSTSDNINISGCGGWVYLNDESGFSTAGTDPVIGTDAGKKTYVAGLESWVALPASYEIKACGYVCGLKLSNNFVSPGTNVGAGKTYNIYTETVDSVGYDYFWGTNQIGNGLSVNALTIGVATSHALAIDMNGTPGYIPVFTDKSWNA